MEKAGTGIKRIKDACEKNKNTCTFSFSDVFSITINSNLINEENENFTENDSRLKKILLFIAKNNKITTIQLARNLNVTKRTILADIAFLKEKNIIRRVGPAKGGHWEIINEK